LAGEPFERRIVARGACYADFDLDGDLDVLVTTSGGQPLLLRNDRANGNRHIRLTLRGTKSNRDAIGAKVHFEAGGLRGNRLVRSGGSYLSQSELPLTIGLGSARQVDRLVVQWPAGSVEEFRSLPAGSRLELIEGKGITSK
jgi:hypothetical protein